MDTPAQIAAQIADAVQGLPADGVRKLIAIAGPPASGKSTVAEVLCDVLNARGCPAGLVAMDGFHLDDAILDERGLRNRKGAPETFDLAGFKALLARLAIEGEVIAPTFNRDLEASIGSSRVIAPAMEWIVVEGNYLLLDEPEWRDLAAVWDYSVALKVGADVTEARLVARWQQHGRADAAARDWIASNDMPNTHRVLEAFLPSDLVIS